MPDVDQRQRNVYSQFYDVCFYVIYNLRTDTF